MTPKLTMCGGALLSLLLAQASGACAHVTLSLAQAPAGGYFTAYLRVGHGCAGSATTALRLDVPPELVTVRPQPKPGWTLRIEHAPLATPVRGEVGRMLSERVSAITWSGGPLPDDEWDEFGVSAKLPARTGPLYLPVVQTCERGEVRWTETPASDRPDLPLAHPAPKVMLGPAAGEPMAGMKMGG